MNRTLSLTILETFSIANAFNKERGNVFKRTSALQFSVLLIEFSSVFKESITSNHFNEFAMLFIFLACMKQTVI